MLMFNANIYIKSLAIGLLYLIIGAGLASTRRYFDNMTNIKKLIWIIYGFGDIAVLALQFSIFMHITEIHPLSDLIMIILNCLEVSISFICIFVFMYL